MTDTLTLTGEELRTKSNLLNALAQRSLTAEAEGLVFSLIWLIKPQVDEFNAQGKKIDEDFAKLKEMDATPEAVEFAKNLRERQKALFAKEFTIKAPKTRLTPKHLPKDKGEGNAVGNVAIRAGLTPEFFEPPTPEAEPAQE